MAQHGGNLADLLPIHSLHDDLVLARRLDRDSLRNQILDGVREPERQIQLLAGHRSAITDADELELLLEAFRDARDHIREMRARGARHRIGERALRARRDTQDAAVDLDLDLGVRLESQAAFLALDRDGPAFDLGTEVFAEIDGLFTYSRHRSDSNSWLEDDAEHFAAVALRLGLNVGHDALRRRHDGHAEAALHDRKLIDALEDWQPRTADALDALDDGLVLVILQLERHHVLAFDFDGGHGLQTAFLLEHLRNGKLLLRRRQRDGRLAGRLRIANARQHVGDRVGHTHSGILTSWPCGDRGSHR